MKIEHTTVGEVSLKSNGYPRNLLNGKFHTVVVSELELQSYPKFLAFCQTKLSLVNDYCASYENVGYLVRIWLSRLGFLKVVNLDP